MIRTYTFRSLKLYNHCVICYLKTSLYFKQSEEKHSFTIYDTLYFFMNDRYHVKADFYSHVISLDNSLKIINNINEKKI